MSCKLLLLLCAIISIIGLLEAASLQVANKNTDTLDVENVKTKNVRNTRQSYTEDDSDEDSDEDDDEEDAELQHEAAIKQELAYEQAVDNSHLGSDEYNDNDDTEDDDEDDDNSYFGLRLRREVSEPISNNVIEEIPKPPEPSENKDKEPIIESTSTSAPTTSSSDNANTSVLILIRDVIKKVTELPNTQQVATSAQQYFQLFEHFLQQTIQQVIGDDDDEDEVESTTSISAAETETTSETTESSDKPLENETSEKESSIEHEVPKPEKIAENVNEVKL